MRGGENRHELRTTSEKQLNRPLKTLGNHQHAQEIQQKEISVRLVYIAKVNA